MKIYFVEEDYEKSKYLEIYFNNEKNIEIVTMEFKEFMEKYNVRCIVSPANSFGLMDGGFDYAITEWFGIQLQKRVQKYIIDNYYGEQPVGTSFIIDAGKDNKYLIHTPTMRVPETIKDERVIYQCMRTTLMVAKENDIDSIAIPMFGGTAGEVKPQVIAKMMRLAYDQLNDIPNEIDWDYANKINLNI